MQRSGQTPWNELLVEGGCESPVGVGGLRFRLRLNGFPFHLSDSQFRVLALAILFLVLVASCHCGESLFLRHDLVGSGSNLEEFVLAAGIANVSAQETVVPVDYANGRVRNNATGRIGDDPAQGCCGLCATAN